MSSSWLPLKLKPVVVLTLATCSVVRATRWESEGMVIFSKFVMLSCRLAANSSNPSLACEATLVAEAGSTTAIHLNLPSHPLTHPPSPLVESAFYMHWQIRTPHLKQCVCACFPT
uniref:Secreted protein n=2 Tax=Aegilops tauschii subsp. strangulata TaxID=200361 RepID=A0A453KV70_AEGTS